MGHDRPTAWEAAGITDHTVLACEQMAVCAVKEGSEEYWRKCRDFLESVKERDYSLLTVKQRNWLFNIQTDLMKEGML